MQNKNFKKIDDYVFRLRKDNLVNLNDLNFLESYIKKKKLKKLRLLMHKNNNSKIHEMLILLSKNHGTPVHKNYNLEKSYYLIKGSFNLNIYNLLKKKIKTIKIDKKNFFFRFEKKVFHSLEVTSKYAIFLETSKGPFKGLKRI